MLRTEQETGRRLSVINQKGTEFELIEFIELLNEEGFEIEGRTIFRTPGGRKVTPAVGEEGKYVVEGSGEVLTRVGMKQSAD